MCRYISEIAQAVFVEIAIYWKVCVFVRVIKENTEQTFNSCVSYSSVVQKVVSKWHYVAPQIAPPFLQIMT